MEQQVPEDGPIINDFLVPIKSRINDLKFDIQMLCHKFKKDTGYLPGIHSSVITSEDSTKFEYLQIHITINA